MNFSIARILAEASRQPAQVIRRGEEDAAHLVYVDEWQRFVALKIYRREIFSDTSVIRRFLDRVASVQARFHSGIAYPFAGGHENGRLYVALQHLPGHHLADLIEYRRHLDAPSLFALADLITKRLEFVHRHYDLAPSLHPNSVCIHRDGPHDWTIGFSDYDLRPLRHPWAYTGEAQAVRDLTLLLYYLHTGTLFPSLDELVVEFAATPGPSNEHPTADLFRHLLGQPEDSRPQTFAEVQRLLEAVMPHAAPNPDLAQPPVSRTLLPWVPDTSRLTDRFQYGDPLASLEFPASFAAWDLLEERASRVHILPPATAEHPNLSALIQQCVKLAHLSDIEGFTPVDSAMVDPSCCLVSEPSSCALSLWDVMKRREHLQLPEALSILKNLAEVAGNLERKGYLLPVLQPQNILLEPTGSSPGADWWRDLSSPAVCRLSIRPLPTNLLFTEAPCLSEIGGTGPSRARATANYFQPGYSSIALAHRVVQSSFQPGEKMPAPLASVFHQALSHSPSATPFLALVTRLEKAARSVLRARQEEGAESPAPPGSGFALAKLRLAFPSYSKSKAPQTA